MRARPAEPEIEVTAGPALAGRCVLRGTPIASYEKSVNMPELPFSPAPGSGKRRSCRASASANTLKPRVSAAVKLPPILLPACRSNLLVYGWKLAVLELERLQRRQRCVEGRARVGPAASPNACSNRSRRSPRDLAHHVRGAGVRHLDGREQRQLRLLGERVGAAVPGEAAAGTRRADAVGVVEQVGVGRRVLLVAQRRHGARSLCARRRRRRAARPGRWAGRRRVRDRGRSRTTSRRTPRAHLSKNSLAGAATSAARARARRAPARGFGSAWAGDQRAPRLPRSCPQGPTGGARPGPPEQTDSCVVPVAAMKKPRGEPHLTATAGWSGDARDRFTLLD